MQKSTDHSLFMRRCLELAKLGAGNVAPNPMVGSVLVHEGRIIGEGYHQQYGHAHAEVNCINSVKEADWPLIESSTIYVSLEPCAHFGKTPPCADLIVAKNIREVVVGCRDPFEAVNGKGIEKLLAAGIPVQSGILEEECIRLNKVFFHFHTKHRPYVILKWAQTSDHYIGSRAGGERLLISNGYSNRLVHKWRSEEMAIMVGTNTASQDDPSLTNRLWTGNNPIRLVLDKNLGLPLSLKLFDGTAPTIVFNSLKTDRERTVEYVKLDYDNELIPQVLETLYKKQIISLIVEGGTRLLQSFIDSGLWNEARIITNSTMLAGKGVPAPLLTNARITSIENYQNDHVQYCLNQNMG